MRGGFHRQCHRYHSESAFPPANALEFAPITVTISSLFKAALRSNQKRMIRSYFAGPCIGPWRSAGLIVMALVLAGCNSFGPFKSQSASEAVTSADGSAQTDIDRFLSSEAGFASATFPSSPWGGNVELTVQPSYYAASGRWCRKMEVTSDVEKQSLVACRDDESGWQFLRSIVASTQHARR